MSNLESRITFKKKKNYSLNEMAGVNVMGVTKKSY